MDTKYNVGQEVYVLEWDLFSDYDLDLECSRDVQNLLKEIEDGNKVIKDTIKAIHIYADSSVRYETRSKKDLRESDISTDKKSVKRNAIRDFQEAWVRQQIRLFKELDDGLTKLLDKQEALD